MNTKTPDLHNPTEHRVSPTADRGLIGDVLGFRPCATLSRELLALGINVVLVVAIALIVQPPLLACLVGGTVVAVILLGRLAAGFATEGYLAKAKGGN